MSNNIPTDRNGNERSYRGKVSTYLSDNLIEITFDISYLKKAGAPKVEKVQLPLSKIYVRDPTDQYIECKTRPKIGSEVRVRYSDLENALKDQDENTAESIFLDAMKNLN